MGNIADSFGFGTESTEADVKEFESTVTGDPKRGNEEGHSKDDGSDNAGWDADTDVKDIAGAGKEPKDDDTNGADDGQQTDEEKAEAKAAADAAAKTKGKDGENDDDDDTGELPEGVKKRVARANRARDREKERADTAEREAETLRKQLAERDKPAEDAKVAPKAEDFDDYEDYLQAKKDFEAKPKPEPKKDEPKPAEPDREVVTAVAEVKALLTDAGHGDVFDKIVEAGEKVPVPRDVVIALADPEAFDHPESVLQALLDDPENAVKLAKMTPAARMKRLVAFDQPYKAPAKGEERGKPAPKLSEAPPPIDQTNGNAKGAVNLDALPFEEFEKVRNAQEAKTKDFW